MSSADVGVDPVSIAVAAGALVVIAAAAAAVMVVRAANAAAEAAVRAVGAYGERLEAEAAGRSAVEAAALRWQCAAADAVALNARIRLLSQRAHAGGEPVDLPPPLDLAGRTVAEVRAW